MIVRGFPCAIGTGATIDGRIEAEVVGFDGDEVILIALQADGSPRQGARVVEAGSSLMAATGDALLGRVPRRITMSRVRRARKFVLFR